MTTLTFFRTSVGGIFLFLLFAQLTWAASPPPNDNLSEATVIPSVPYTSSPQDIAGATFEPDESLPSCRQDSGAGGSFWYQYTPTNDQEVAFDAGFAGIRSVTLSVWVGTTYPLTELVCLREDLVVPWFTPVTLTAGTTYYIGIVPDMQFSEESIFTLKVNPVVLADNDNLANAITIPTLPYTSTNNASYTLGTVETNELASSCITEKYSSVWYQYIPTHNHTAVIDITSNVLGVFRLVSVWTGTIHPLTELACSDTQLALDLTAGNSYYINVGNALDWGENTLWMSDWKLDVNELTQAPNDDLANATLITSLPYESHQQAQWATPEPLEVNGCGSGEGNNSVWYQYTPTTDQEVALHLGETGLGPTRGALLSVWNGTNHPLTELNCQGFYGDNSLLLKLTAGTAYYLKITTEGALNFSLSVFLVTPPTNDNLANATIISALPYSNASQETFGSTYEELEVFSDCEEGGEPYFGTVWYQYTPTQNQTVEFHVQSERTPVLSIWSGIIHPLTSLRCLNDGDRLKLTAGTTYLIKVSAPFDWESLLVSFDIQDITISNDDLANATVISALPYSHSQNTQWATTEPGEVSYEQATSVSCSDGWWGWGDSGNSVWYQYTPDHDQLVEFDTLGSSYNTVLSIWTGTAHPLTALTCNDDEYGVFFSQVNLKLTAHTTYYIRVSSYYNLADAGSLLNLYAQEVLPPSNDNLDQAISITSLPYTHQQNTQGASLEAEEVNASCVKSRTGMSVWYKYTPTTSQTVMLDTQTSSYDTVLSVWTGHSQPLTEIACHDDLSTTDLQSKLRVALTAGTIYWINVSGVQSDSYLPLSPGNLVLTVTANDLELSPLGTANMIDALGNPVTSSTTVWGGISVNGTAYQTQVVENLADEVEVWGKMEVEPSHVGQTAEIVVYASYKSSASVPEEYFYMVDNRYSIYVWDQNPANLMVLQKVTLAPEQWQAIYRGRFQVPGVLDIYWGYRLTDGTVVTNSQGLRVTINRQVNQY